MSNLKQQLALLMLFVTAFGLVQPALAADRIEIDPNNLGALHALQYDAKVSPFLLYALKHVSNNKDFTCEEYQHWQPGDRLYVTPGAKPNRKLTYENLACKGISKSRKPAPSTPPPAGANPSPAPVPAPSTGELSRVQGQLNEANRLITELRKKVSDLETDKADLQKKLDEAKVAQDVINQQLKSLEDWKKTNSVAMDQLKQQILQLETKLKALAPPAPSPKPAPTKAGLAPHIPSWINWLLVLAGLLVALFAFRKQLAKLFRKKTPVVTHIAPQGPATPPPATPAPRPVDNVRVPRPTVPAPAPRPTTPRPRSNRTVF